MRIRFRPSAAMALFALAGLVCAGLTGCGDSAGTGGQETQVSGAQPAPDEPTAPAAFKVPSDRNAGAPATPGQPPGATATPPEHSVDTQRVPEQPAESPEDAFENMDADGNGKLSHEEIQGHGLARLLSGDADGDGELTLDEFKTVYAQMHQGPRAPRAAGVDHIFSRFDTDGDGKLGENELPGRMKERFAEVGVDADGDGSISKEEFEKGRMQIMQSSVPAGEEPRAGRGFLENLDANGDGKITKDEVPPQMSTRFDALDTDKDGVLSDEELQALRSRMGPGRGPGRRGGPGAGGFGGRRGSGSGQQ